MGDEEGMDSSEFESGSDDEVEVEEILQVKCLFCEHISASILKSAEHSKTEHSFDVRGFISKRVSNHYELVKIITYIRRNKPTVDYMKTFTDSRPWLSDEYMLPVDNDDAWLWAIDGLSIDMDEEEEELKYVNAENGVVTLSKEHFDELQERNQRLECLLREQDKKLNLLRTLLSEEPEAKKIHTEKKNTNTYFDSYSDFGIHREMLQDIPRMNSYHEAINKTIFNGKVVLDVGCGTGILSMMAASAGAIKVVGVENSDIFDAAVEIVRENGLESIVKLVKGDIMHIDLDERFDILISEWMGYFLLFERMLESIIFARDKFLKKDGLILPNQCQVSLAGCSDPDSYEDRMNSKVFGFTMTPLKRAAVSEPIIEQIPSDKIVTESCLVHQIDLLDRINTRSDNCCSYSSDFCLKVLRDCTITSICSWFTCAFEPTTVILSTSPYSCSTHWAQTNFYLSQPHEVKANSTISGKIRVEPRQERGLRISIEIPSFNERRTYIFE